MTGGRNDARLPYTLSPYHSSSLYTVSSLIFLIHCLLITPLPYTVSLYHSSSLHTVSSLIFLQTPRFVLGLLLSVVCSWFVFPSVCCSLVFACCEWTGGTRPSSPASSPGSSIRRLFRNDNKTRQNKLKRDTSDIQYILLNWLQSLNTMDGPFQQHLVCMLVLSCSRFVFKS